MITTKHCYIMVKIKVVIWKISAKGESVMKKRVTAWLLCVCMLLTATPEVLLASTEAEKQAPEAAVQETERFETEESEAVRTGTEGTESAEPPKEDVEIGSGTEAIPEEPGNDEEIENGGEAEETQTEEAEAPGGIGAEETESVGTEKVEETEESEVPEVSEESGVEEEIATTEETGLTEESETAGEIERTEETEAIEETETGETEEADLTAEELQLLEDEVAMELSALYGMNTRAAGVTEEQIYLLAPVYLANEQYDKIIANCGTMSLEAINSVSETDTIIAAYMHGLKDGSGVLWNEFWASCGLSDSTYQDFETKAAKEVLYEYMRVNKNLKKASDAVEKDLDGFKEVYDLMSDEGKREFTEIIKANKPLLTEAEAEKMAKGLLKQTDTLMKYVDTTAELFVMTVAIAEMQMIELQALDDLIVIHNQVKDPAMRDALARLRTDITTNVETYIVATYVKDDVLKGLQSIVKEAAKKLVPGNIKIHDFEWGLGKLVAKTIASVYESYKPSASDIIYSSLLYQYWMDSNMAVAHYQHLFRMGEGTADDIRYYEAAVNFNAVCTKMLLSKSKKLVKNSNKRLYSRMDCWESSMGSEVNYELYISSCIANATKAVQAGTLVIEQDSATIKDKNGNVIDENHDSTESIKAKFAAIQNQYKPNVGQTWNGNWGGTYQCFGFARMVFSKLFGCEMSNRYVSGEKYKYASESNVNLIGQVSGGNVTAASAQGLLQQGKLGDIIQACGAGNGGQHTMVFVSADANGVTVYDCNTRLSASEPACAIHQWTIGWADWAAWYGTADSNSQNGISLYRASNYAQIYGDGDGMFYDDSVNFVIQNGVLTKYNGWQSFVEIPDTVTAIGDDAFQENTSMVSVSIPDGVKSIGNRAFYGCSALLGVVIPDSVGSIGKSAFQDCSRLASAYLPVNEKFTVVSDGAFSGCKALKGITVPDSVVEIEGSAFYRCENLADVRLSGNIESIGGAAFGYCNKITEIYLPKSLNRDTGSRWYGGAGGPFACCDNLKSVKYEAGLTAIPSAFFQDCSGLEEIVLPDSITVIRSNTFLRCGNLKRIVIPDSVTEIGEGAFSQCISIEGIEMPDSVTEIGLEAFFMCENLSDVRLSESIESIGGAAFGYCNKITEIYLPKSLNQDTGSRWYGGAGGPFAYCDNLKSVTYETGLTSIPSAFFQGCSGLEEIVLPDSITVIRSNTFLRCSNLKRIVIPDSVTEIGEGAFSQCISIEGIEIPDSVTEIGLEAFFMCENLSDVRLSESIESIGGAAFGYCNKITEIYLPKSLNQDTGSRWYGGAGGPFACCDNLKSVKYEAGLTAIPSAFFQDCSGLEEIVLPDSITVIRSNTFLRCGNLKRIVIPDSVTEIGGAAFKGCVALKAVQIPDTVTDMGIEIFSGCTNLTEVHLPNKLENLPQSTFYNCKKLAAANFPSTLKEIERYAFYGCEALPQAVLPDTVTSIGSEAFYGCEALTDVTLGSGLKVINSKTFCGCTSLTSVVLPYQVASVEDSAFVNCTSLAKITIPRKTTSIASNAFSYPKKLTVYGPTGSYAQQYASQKGIKFVAQDIRATSVRLNVTGKTMEKWDEFQLMATVAPQNFTDEIIWTSSDENVATVSEDGYVEACGGGQAVIAVKAGAAKATCTVTVKQYVNWIEFSDGNISMKAGETRQLAVTISPENATDKRLEYTSSNPAVATVSASGVVTAKKQGETTITAKAKDGSGEYDTCYVTVTGAAKVTGISLNRTSAVVKKGKTLTLQAKITPDYAANKKVTWKSSNTKVATVDGKGKVTGKAAGRATITVISSENSSCKASCTVTVPYTINYKLNKGKNNSKNPDSYYRQKVTLKDPTRKGYAFKGWYTDKKFKNKIKSISKNANKNYTLYAKWEKVTVKKTQISSAKNSRSKQLLLKYKKVQGAKGYEISYSTDKKFKKGVTKKTTGKTSYTIKGLKKGKTYYVRIRAYQVDSTGKKVYGKYSSVKKVKITK